MVSRESKFMTEDKVPCVMAWSECIKCGCAKNVTYDFERVDPLTLFKLRKVWL
jgi:hypothetical protein